MFDLIHCDTWGPYQFLTHNGYKYFLTIVDDHTGYTWVFFMKQKSDTLDIVSKFFTFVENHFNFFIKFFRSDNALELSFTDFFLSKGVIHQFSCVERPKQNSVVERKHQHLLNCYPCSHVSV